MSYLFRSFLNMMIVIGAMCTSIFFLRKTLIHIFFHNIWLNGFIFFIIFVTIVLSFLKLRQVQVEQKWLDHLGDQKNPLDRQPHLEYLAAFSVIIQNETIPSYISPLNAKSILSSIENRLQESREPVRYCIGLLVFLGLLGTFWGLSQTVIGISGVIHGLDLNTTDVKDAFQILKQGLSAPLSGMGTAFSCSMFGLAGSLITGFIDLQVGRAASQFYNKLEEQLSSLTRFAPFSGNIESTTQSSGSAFSLTLLEQAIEGMASLHEQLRKSEDSRLTILKAIQVFSEKLSEMSEYMMAHQAFSQKLAQHQVELQEMLLSLSKEGAKGRNEEIIKTHVRSIDATLNKLLEESVEGRQKTVQDIRQEIRFVTKTLSALASPE